MMLFHEIYSAYYNAVSAILKRAVSAPVTDKDIRETAKEYAFGESFLTIAAALKSGAWPLLTEDCKSVTDFPPHCPLTTLEKRWLKAIFADPRARLFSDIFPDFPDVTPLFGNEDICVFDRYGDGDDYENPEYIRNFRLVADAVKNHYPLLFGIKTRKDELRYITAVPEYLEYSEKDDKFRVITSSKRGNTMNMSRILFCRKSTQTAAREDAEALPPKSVTLEVTNERNTLERVLLHFAHFEKEAEKTDSNRYRVTIRYDVNDETEMVVRILSFGPFVKVIAPDGFTDLMKERLQKQMRCGLF